MNTDIPHKTAKIYQFPVGGRAMQNTRSETMEEVAARYAHFVDSDSWYHQEAISDRVLIGVKSGPTLIS